MPYNDVISFEEVLSLGFLSFLDKKQKKKDMIPEFFISELYLISVTVAYDWDIGYGRSGITTNADHPAFDALRHRLGVEGLIKIDKQSWNGDRVLSDFKLNNVLFTVGEQFPCGSAMCSRLKRFYE